MKDGNNKELDLLLRNLAKRSRSAGGDSLPAGEHLDADELNSFAEGVLPEATRVLYVSHLADCDRCRKIVAQLMAASGNLVQSRTGSAKAGLWSYLSDIFTPKVLRFALPVLSLAIIAGIGFMLMRQQAQPDSVAQVSSEERALEAPQAANSSEPRLAQKSSENYGDSAKDSPSAKHVEAKKQDVAVDGQTKSANEAVSDDKAKETREAEKAEKSGAKEETAQARVDSAAVGGRAEVNTPKPQAETARERGTFTSQPAPPASSAGNLAKTAERKLRDQAQEEEDRRDAAKKGSGARASVATVTSSENKNKDKDKDEEQAAATRTVAGRRFRSSGNGWIDTAYASSMSLTNVARGSEQYRALIGDEPGLRTIAEQLSGEVIVVWKGKAYRIR